MQLHDVQLFIIRQYSSESSALTLLMLTNTSIMRFVGIFLIGMPENDDDVDELISNSYMTISTYLIVCQMMRRSKMMRK